MLKRKTNPPLDARLDRAGREIVSAALSEAEAERVAASPFLYARVRARIAERERQETGENWLAMLMVAWRAVPAMALVALFAFSLFWFASFGSTPFGGLSDDAFFGGANDAGMARVVFEDRRPLSQEEIFSVIVGRDEREVTR